MRFYENSIIFEYSWEQIAVALWKRYPNPESSHVLSEDTISRKIVGSQLHTKRLLTKTNRLPKWGERFVNARHVAIVEESVIDPVSKEINTYTRNIGFNKMMSCIEKVTYKPSTNPNFTVVEKKAWIDSKIFGVGYAIQKFGLERYRKNATKANAGFLFALSQLFSSPIPNNATSLTSHDLLHRKPEDNRQRLKVAAKKAKEIAQEKIYASCETET